MTEPPWTDPEPDPAPPPAPDALDAIRAVCTRWRRDTRELCARIYQHPLVGRPAAVFTDGTFMLAQQAREASALPPVPLAWRAAADLLLDRARNSPRMSLPLGEVLRLAGERPPPAWPECDECWGTGKTTRLCEHCDESHECTCPACDAGKILPDRTMLELDGALFDRRIVAESLYFAAVEAKGGRLAVGVSETLLIAPADKTAPWLVCQAGPRLGIVMSCRRLEQDPDTIVRACALESLR